MTIKGASLLEAIRAPASPFPGLRPFEFCESHLFFGRDGQVERLITKLTDTRFLAVVGTSGSGKSSLVRAGLLPALVGGMMASAGSKWRIAVMRPSNDPIGSLARALNQPDVFGSDDPDNAAIQIVVAEATLRRGSRGLVEAVRQTAMPAEENLLVVVDQFEELFRFAREASRKTKDESESYQNDAAAFVKLLLEAKGQRETNIYVVLTMRSDFLGDCARFWDLPEATNESQYLIPRLTRDQLREVIAGPVALGGGEIAPRLVTQLLNDIGDNQDQLPVLQHLLMRVWDEWKEKRLEVEVKDGDATVRKPHSELHQGQAIDLCCYEAVGGMAEALSRHADEAFNELPDDHHRQIAEKLFKALTEKGPDNREVRRPITLGEICTVADATAPELITVIEAFRHPRKSFLMPPAGVSLNAESLIDISHESLIRGWQPLTKWVDEEARSARIYRRLAETAELHREGKAGLWGDPDLQFALDWQVKNNPNRDWARRYHPGFKTAIAFLRASDKKRAGVIAELERQQQAEIERAKRELEQAQALAEAEQRRAQAERHKAKEQRQRLEEKARAASKLRRLIAALVIAALLAVAAIIVSLFLARKARQALAVAKTAETDAGMAFREAEQNKVLASSLTAKANKLAESAERQKQSAERQKKLAEELQQKAEAAKFEAEAQRRNAIEQQGIAEEREKSNRALIYVANMKLAQQAYGENDFTRLRELLDLYSPDGVGPAQDDLRGFEWYHFSHLYHKEPTTLKEHSNYVTAVAFSSDGKTLAAAGDKTVTLWDTGSLGKPASLEVEPSLFHAVAFARDGTLATLSVGTVRLWDAKGVKKEEFQVPHSSYPSLAFSPDGNLLAVAGGEP